jgi:hypothetical protein
MAAGVPVQVEPVGVGEVPSRSAATVSGTMPSLAGMTTPAEPDVLGGHPLDPGSA